MSDTLKLLKKEVKRAKGIESGSVVTFDREIDKFWNPMRREAVPLPGGETKIITYAAIFVNNAWYLTGQGNLGKSKLTNREFFDHMAEPDIYNIRLATKFESVDDEEDWRDV